MSGNTAVRVRYLRSRTQPWPEGVLAAVQFGADQFGAALNASGAAGLTVNVQLDLLDGMPVAELWLAQGKVLTGQVGSVRFAHDDHFLFGCIEIDERQHTDVRAATAAAYAAIRHFQMDSAFPHLLRMWNFLDAVNDGEGDLERYRQFCIGRAHGLADISGEHYPAATAVGRQRTTHALQVAWLAGRTRGTAVENPRQVSAYRYPRAHGPVSPSFSRATVTPDGTVLISGTASIVGHISQHLGNPLAQLDETLRNLDALIERARAHRQADTSAGSMLLKVYLRDPAHLDVIARRLQDTFPNEEAIFLAADICRSELLLEIECVAGQEGDRG